jgi:hypothetical protein
MSYRSAHFTLTGDQAPGQCPSDTELPRVSLGISFRRVGECHIGGLPRFEVECDRLLEVK